MDLVIITMAVIIITTIIMGIVPITIITISLTIERITGIRNTITMIATMERGSTIKTTMIIGTSINRVPTDMRRAIGLLGPKLQEILTMIIIAITMRITIVVESIIKTNMIEVEEGALII